MLTFFKSYSIFGNFYILVKVSSLKNGVNYFLIALLEIFVFNWKIVNKKSIKIFIDYN